jgi:hypothetical protein
MSFTGNRVGDDWGGRLRLPMLEHWKRSAAPDFSQDVDEICVSYFYWSIKGRLDAYFGPSRNSIV